MSAASVRLRFAQLLFVAAGALLVAAVYDILGQIVVIEQPYADRPDTDIPSFAAWHFVYRPAFSRLTAFVEEIR